MSTTYQFSNHTDFEFFQSLNCCKNGGCWEDREENCPIIADLLAHGHDPHIVRNTTGLPTCQSYISIPDGNKRQYQQEQAVELEQHYGGLFSEPIPGFNPAATTPTEKDTQP